MPAAIALGSNLGDRPANLFAALRALATLGTVTAISTFHDTAPVGYLDQPNFLNAAVILQTSLSPIDLLHALLEIERKLGRDRSTTPPKGPRSIDLDLLVYDALILTTPELTLPHPALHERAFVLDPLSEIAPTLIHPTLHRSILDLAADLKARTS